MDTVSIDTAIRCSGIVAAIVAILLISSQFDIVARNILSPQRLRAKRRQEQLHKLQKAIAQSILYIRRYINNGNFYDWAEEKKITDLIQSDGAVQSLVEEIVASFSSDEKSQKEERAQKTPLIVGISKDLTLAKADEWYIHLAFPFISSSQDPADMEDYTKVQYGKRVQVPLAKFGKFCSLAFKKQSSQPTFCFIADASSSLGSKIVGDIIQKSKLGIPLIQEPAWMFTLSFLIQRRCLEKESMEQVVYALCRLSAQRVAHKIGPDYNTIVVTLPGQGSTAPLITYLQKIFPFSRYVLMKEECVASIQRAQQLCKTSKGTYENSRSKGNFVTSTWRSNVIPETVMPREVSSTISIQALRVKQLSVEMASLHSNLAAIMEAWISSVSAFKFSEKDSKIKSSMHVCNLHTLLDHDNDKQCRETLCQLLEYVVGYSENSGGIGEHELDAASSILIQSCEDLLSYEQKATFTDEELLVISKCQRVILEVD